MAQQRSGEAGFAACAGVRIRELVVTETMETVVEEGRIQALAARAEATSEVGLRLRAVTVGAVLAGLIVIAATWTRLYALGSRPLDEAEAARAWLAFRFVQGQAVELTDLSPLLTNLNLLVFFLAGASDFLARLVPALFGIGLVALPVVRFRHRLGIGGALVSSALIAFSPGFLLFSRSVDPAVVSAATSLAFIGVLFDYIDYQRHRDLVLASGALALALTAGPGTYTVLLFLLVFGCGSWALHRFRGTGGWDRARVAYEAARRDQAALARAGAVFGVAFVVAATAFLVNFGGIQASLNLFVEWLRSFSLTREYPIWYYAGVLVLYEPAILLFGLLGAAFAIRRRDFLGLFLVTWFIGSLVLYTLVGATEPALVMPILLPLAVLAGWGVASIFESVDTDELLRALLVAAFIIPLLVYAVLQLAFYAETAARSVNLFLALGAAGMAVVVAVVFASSRFGMAWRLGTVACGVGISLLLLTVSLAVHTTWQLNFLRQEPMRELLLDATTSHDVRKMAAVLEAVSQDRLGDTVAMPITVDGRLGAVVPWYLRHFNGVTVVDGIHQPPGTPAVIMPATDTLPPIGDQYVGQGFRLTSRWRPMGLTGSDFMRWYFYREGPVAPTTDLIVFVTPR